MATPLISIIMPTYNRADLLPRSISSALRQSETRWEMIIVDDDGEDGTRQLIQHSFADARIHYFRLRRHVGLSRSVNSGLRRTQGRYITFIDSDDAYTPHHLSQHLSYMRRHPGVDLIHGGARAVGSPYVPDKNNLHRRIHISRVAMRSTFFGKHEVFTTLHGFRDLPYSEESEFLHRAEQVFTVRRVNFGTYRYYRDVPDSITHIVAAKNKR